MLIAFSQIFKERKTKKAQQYPDSQEEKWQTLWAVALMHQLRSDRLKNCSV